MKQILRAALLTAALLAALPTVSALAAETPVETEDIITQTVTIEEQVSFEEESGRDLFLGYLEQDAEDRAALQGNAGSALTGLNAEIYGILKNAVEDIADGRSRYTSITIDTRDLPGYAFSRDGLYNETDPTKPITEDRMKEEGAKLLSEAGYNFETISNALIADCPYALYWFNKSNQNGDGGLRSGTPIAMSASSYSMGSFSFLSCTVTVTQLIYSFPVAQGYRDPSSGDLYTVRDDLDDAIAAVRSSAASIVQANEGKSDYEKLLAYKEAICSLTSYNSPAAAGSVPFGDPWQIIYVFDGDSATTVVCEGYSKAFQYLCDLSSFRGGTECYTLQGYQYSDGSGEDHMWNHVLLDGAYYLVDITNCDTGAVGYPDLLFLRGAQPYDDGSNTGYQIPAGYRNVYYLNVENAYAGQEEILRLSAEDYDPSVLPPLASSDFLFTLPADSPYDGEPHPAAVSWRDESLAALAGTLSTVYRTVTGETLLSAPVDAGTYNVYARVSGGSGYDAQDLPLGSLTILPAAPTLTARENPIAVEAGGSYVAAVTLTGIGGAPIPSASLTVSGLYVYDETYTTDNEGYLEISGSAGGDTGTYDLTIRYEGSGNYAPAEITVSVTVTETAPPAPPVIALDGTRVTVSTSDPDLLGKQVFFSAYSAENRFLTCATAAIGADGAASASLESLTDAACAKAFLVEPETLSPLSGPLQVDIF